MTNFKWIAIKNSPTIRGSVHLLRGIEENNEKPPDRKLKLETVDYRTTATPLDNCYHLPCSAYVNRRFGDNYHFHLQGKNQPSKKPVCSWWLRNATCCKLFLALLIFGPEYGGDNCLRNVCSHTDYTEDGFGDNYHLHLQGKNYPSKKPACCWWLSNATCCKLISCSADFRPWIWRW
jgi:hypothetical protein